MNPEFDLSFVLIISLTFETLIDKSHVTQRIYGKNHFGTLAPAPGSGSNFCKLGGVVDRRHSASPLKHRSRVHRGRVG